MHFQKRLNFDLETHFLFRTVFNLIDELIDVIEIILQIISFTPQDLVVWFAK